MTPEEAKELTLEQVKAIVLSQDPSAFAEKKKKAASKKKTTKKKKK